MAAFLAAAKALKKQTEPNESNSVPREDSDHPFNLEEIFDNEANEKMKSIMKYVFDNLDKCSSKVDQVDLKMQSKFMEIQL